MIKNPKIQLTLIVILMYILPALCGISRVDGTAGSDVEIKTVFGK